MPPVLALLLLLAVVTLGYLVACRFWPYAACPRCSGAGKRRSLSGRAWRTCHRCHGSGARLRIGRRISNALTQQHRRARR